MFLHKEINMNLWLLTYFYCKASSLQFITQPQDASITLSWIRLVKKIHFMKVLISYILFLAPRCKKIFSQRKKWRGPRADRNSVMLQSAHILNRRVCVYVCERGSEWERERAKLGVKILSSGKASQSVCCVGKQQHSEGFHLGECLRNYQKFTLPEWRSSGWLVKVMHNGDVRLSVLCLDTFERNHMSGEWNEW